MLALDTNILAYAEGVNDAVRQARALDVIAGLDASLIVVPVQVLGELYRVLTVKAGRSPDDARAAILSWRDALATRDTSATALLAAMDLVVDHKMSFWDALILAVAAEAGCRILLTEGLGEGFTWRGVNPLLAGLLATRDGSS